MTSIFHMYIHLLHMIIHTVALWLVSYCMMNKTHTVHDNSCLLWKRWEKTLESKLKLQKQHGNTSYDGILGVLLPLHQAHNGYHSWVEGWRTKLHHFNRLLEYCTHTFWVMQNSEDIQGKYYGISRLSHLTLTLLRMVIYDKTAELQTDKTEQVCSLVL